MMHHIKKERLFHKKKTWKWKQEVELARIYPSMQ